MAPAPQVKFRSQLGATWEPTFWSSLEWSESVVMETKVVEDLKGFIETVYHKDHKVVRNYKVNFFPQGVIWNN